MSARFQNTSTALQMEMAEIRGADSVPELSCLDYSSVCVMVEIPFYCQSPSLIAIQEMSVLIVSACFSEQLISLGSLVSPCYTHVPSLVSLSQEGYMTC